MGYSADRQFEYDYTNVSSIVTLTAAGTGTYLFRATNETGFGAVSVTTTGLALSYTNEWAVGTVNYAVIIGSVQLTLGQTVSFHMSPNGAGFIAYALYLWN